MMPRSIVSSIVTAIVLTACASPGGPQGGDSQPDPIPMYGFPEVEKSAAQKKADEDFIKTVSVTEGSREKGEQGICGRRVEIFKRR